MESEAGDGNWREDMNRADFDFLLSTKFFTIIFWAIPPEKWGPENFF
jgi:hypothetical protein